MDIDKCIENTIKEVKQARSAQNDNDFCLDQKNLECKKNDLQQLTLKQLCDSEILDEDTKIEIYQRMLSDAQEYIDSFVDSPRCKDPNADKGMIKCYHETFQFICKEFGIEYFMKNKYLHHTARERKEGGYRFRDELLEIGLEVYEELCNEYRKVYQVFDCCSFLGIHKEWMFRLSDLHAQALKKMHASTESSLRIGALTGRGNVTGHAIILNHDYNYTRTSEVIHTSVSDSKKAVALPVLEDAPQHIVVDSSAVVGAIPDNGL